MPLVRVDSMRGAYRSEGSKKVSDIGTAGEPKPGKLMSGVDLNRIDSRLQLVFTKNDKRQESHSQIS